MYQQRTALIAFIVAVMGTILQIVGIFTPGWQVGVSTEFDSITSGGLWSTVTCLRDTCETTTFYERYIKAIEDNPKSSAGNYYVFFLIFFKCQYFSIVFKRSKISLY